MEEYIKSTRDFTSDVFLTLPIIIVGFVFFIGTLTSNVGMLYLFVGHAILVPSLSFLANVKGSAWFENDSFSMLKLFRWLFSVSSVFFTLLYGFRLDVGNWLWYIPVMIPFVGQFIMHHLQKDKSVFWFFNIAAWFTTPNDITRAAATCDLLPGGSELKYPEISPSKWVTHIAFFFGFIFSNAAAIYNQPSPIVRSGSDEADTAARQAKVNERVGNRKVLSAGIMTSSIIILLITLGLRYWRTPCEAGFLYSLIPSIIIATTGACWFNILYYMCGVKPTDVLGIVQGMISPDMADNPIVCLGS